MNLTYYGKTKHEKRVLDILEKSKSDLEKKTVKINEKIQKLKIDQGSINKDIFKINMKQSDIYKRIEKRCNHNYGRKYWANMRDDASFDNYCACSNCGKILWDECK